MSREQQATSFLERNGRAGVARRILAQDASFRCYWRLADGTVLMDAPPPHEDVRPFLRLQSHLHAAGLSVPDVLGADADAGFVLLEDFGDALFPTLLAPDTTQMLYDAAVDAMVRMHAATPPDDVPRWDPAAMQAATAATFLDWWWPATFGQAASDAVRTEFQDALTALLAPLSGAVTNLVHRDFFAGNLFWLPRRAGPQRVGIIDFQDAALGHPAYDLVSLVEDARRALPPGLAERQIARYLQQRPTLDPDAFRAAYAACAAQRHCRVAALWTRLARRDGKPGYLTYGPHSWGLLDAALARPSASPLAAFFDRHVPRALRANPADTCEPP